MDGLRSRNRFLIVARLFKPPLNLGWGVVPYCVSGGREKEEHRWQQALAEAERSVRRLCPEGGLVCDPFAGSGTVLIAARNLGRRAVGFEIDPGTAERARTRIAEAEAPDVEPQVSAVDHDQELCEELGPYSDWYAKNAAQARQAARRVIRDVLADGAEHEKAELISAVYRRVPPELLARYYRFSRACGNRSRRKNPQPMPELSVQVLCGGENITDTQLDSFFCRKEGRLRYYRDAYPERPTERTADVPEATPAERRPRAG